jgi:uncharacterized RDD family membrane protein YckC
MQIWLSWEYIILDLDSALFGCLEWCESIEYIMQIVYCGLWVSLWPISITVAFAVEINFSIYILILLPPTARDIFVHQNRHIMIMPRTNFSMDISYNFLLYHLSALTMASKSLKKTTLRVSWFQLLRSFIHVILTSYSILLENFELALSKARCYIYSIIVACCRNQELDRLIYIRYLIPNL